MLMFKVGETVLAIPASRVREVVRAPATTRVPHAPESLLGLANLRGAVTPIISTARLLDQAPQDTAVGRVVVVDGDRPIGLAVDAIVGLDAIPAAKDPAGAALFVRDGDAVRVIELEARLSAAFSASRPEAAPRRTAAAAAPAPSGAAAVPREERALLTFDLAGQPYGLPLEAVVEVRAAPAEATSLPRAELADYGLVPDRDGLLPVIGLGALLGLSPSLDPARARMIVVRIGEARVGLVVDRLSAIVRLGKDRLAPTPAVLNRGGGEASIAAIARLEAGGVAAVLSPDQLFREAAMARILADGPQEREAEMMQDHAGDLERFLVFQLGEETYGFPLSAVDEVVRSSALTRVPGAPAFVEGVLVHRGAVVPIIDQSRRFNLSPRQGAERRIIMTSVNGHRAGFVVDAVSDLVALSPDALRPASDLMADERRVFDRVATMGGEDQVVLVVDPEALLAQAEADILADISRRGAQTLSDAP